jgi:ketosteroid isomerase-like protein
MKFRRSQTFAAEIVMECQVLRSTKWLLAFALVAVLSVPAATAQTEGDRPKTKSAGTRNVEQTLTQIEDEWGKAFEKKDTASLDKILAADWVGQYPYGSRTKKQLFEDIQSEAVKLSDVNTGPMKVRVFGNVAIVTGSDDSKLSYKGKDYSGHDVWTDVFVKRNGRWEAVASQNGLAEKP